MYLQPGQILSTKIIKDSRSTETKGEIGQQGMIRQLAENNLFVTYLARRDQANQDVCQNQKGGGQKDIFGFKERQGIECLRWSRNEITVKNLLNDLLHFLR